LTFGPGARLYVAQAGSGATNGKITEISNPWASTPVVRDVVTGLFSAVHTEGEAVGVDGISAQGNGNIFAVMALSNEALGFPSSLGHLLQVSQAGQIRDVADVGDFDFEWSKAHLNLASHDFPDSNPYAVLALPIEESDAHFENKAERTNDHRCRARTPPPHLFRNCRDRCGHAKRFLFERWTVSPGWNQHLGGPESR
jgi:hypothetical protein